MSAHLLWTMGLVELLGKTEGQVFHVQIYDRVKPKTEAALIVVVSVEVVVIWWWGWDFGPWRWSPSI